MSVLLKAKALIRRKLLQQPQSIVGPRMIQFEITSRCNLKCPMCPRETLGWKEEHDQDIGLEEFRELLKGVPTSVDRFIFAGMGEALLAIDAPLYIEAASKFAKCTLITNVTALSSRMTQQLLDAGIDEFVFSVDGPNIAAYEAMRTGASYEMVERKVREVAEKVRLEYPHVQLKVNTVVMESNYDLVPEMLEWCSDRGIYRIGLLYNSDPTANLPVDYIPDFTFWKQTVQQQASQYCIEVTFGGGDSGESRENRSYCRRPWTDLFVSFKGEVSPCCIHETEKKDWVGNALNRPLSEIWTAPAIQAFRAAMGTDSPPKMCQGCSHYLR